MSMYRLFLRPSTATRGDAQVPCQDEPQLLWCVPEHRGRTSCQRSSIGPTCGDESAKLPQERVLTFYDVFHWRNRSFRGIATHSADWKPVEDSSFAWFPAVFHTCYWRNLSPGSLRKCAKREWWIGMHGGATEKANSRCYRRRIWILVVFVCFHHLSNRIDMYIIGDTHHML